jgi:hypothetical protein
MFQQCNERAHFHVNGRLRRLAETLHLILHHPPPIEPPGVRFRHVV